MYKKMIAVVVIFFFMMIISLNTQTCSMSTSPVKEIEPLLYTDKVNNTTSFHTNISGSRFWVAIKGDFFDLTKISFHKFVRYSLNGSSLNSYFDLIFSQAGSYFYDIGTCSPKTSPDYYFQYHLGPLNRSYYHYVDNITHWGWFSSTTSTCKTNGTYYFVWASYMTECSTDIWINFTGNATFSMTNGTEVFTFDRHDFLGNINMGWKKGTFIVNGKKEIQVKNQLFASFDTSVHSTGYEFLQYRSPTGKKNWKFCVDKKGEHLFTNQSSDFQKNLWWAKNGTWSFTVNMLNMGLNKLTPNVYLIGADIQLPE
jgi:hypothetical protein